MAHLPRLEGKVSERLSQVGYSVKARMGVNVPPQARTRYKWAVSCVLLFFNLNWPAFVRVATSDVAVCTMSASRLRLLAGHTLMPGAALCLFGNLRNVPGASRDSLDLAHSQTIVPRTTVLCQPRQPAAARDSSLYDRATASNEADGLFEAIERRDLNEIRRLLDDEACIVDARNKEGLTPLLVAARSREGARIVEVLISAGASPEARDKLGRTALHFACLSGNSVSARVLLQAGACASQRDGRRGATPAHYAAAFARVEVLRVVLAADPDAATARDCLGRTPLHWSALSAHRDWASARSLEVAALLVEFGANPGARDRTGSTPAHTAARLGALNFLDVLIKFDQHHRNVQRKYGILHESDNHGLTPLDIAVAKFHLTRYRSRFLWTNLPAWTGLTSFSLALSMPRSFSAFCHFYDKQPPNAR